MPVLAGALTALLMLVAGCRRDLHSPESALSPAGPQAQRISTLTWWFIGVCVVVYILVMIALIFAFIHRRHAQTMGPSNEPVTEPDPHHEGRIWTGVSTAILITVITLFALLFGDFATGRALNNFANNKDPLRIKVIAHQWWWDVQYIDWPERYGERVPSNIVRTAGEIHIPVDSQHPIAVNVELESADVIHSFWVPSLHGKKDIIPGHGTSIQIGATRPGTYWGECAEYCGYQHAQMRLVVVAQPEDEFKSWMDAQRQLAPEPSNEVLTRGRNVFLHGTCAMCHTIAGTDARSRVGPDLTHVASRKLLASGAIPNAPGHLAGWIVDPQKIKPGARMPQNNLEPQDLRSLLEYMETLK